MQSFTSYFISSYYSYYSFSSLANSLLTLFYDYAISWPKLSEEEFLWLDVLLLWWLVDAFEFFEDVLCYSKNFVSSISISSWSSENFSGLSSEVNSASHFSTLLYLSKTSLK